MVLVDDRELLSEFDKEDQEIAQEELKMFNILDIEQVQKSWIFLQNCV